MAAVVIRLFPDEARGQAKRVVVDQLLDVRAHGTFLHAVQAFAGERHQQQPARGHFVDSARAQIEQRIFFHLADGRAVRALHVVGVNFELRLGVDLRVIGKQQVAVGLLGVGFLRVLVHDDAAVKHAVRVAVEDAVVELAAAAMRAGVFDEHVVVEVLAAIADEQAIDQALAAFARKNRDGRCCAPALRPAAPNATRRSPLLPCWMRSVETLNAPVCSRSIM